VPRQGVERDAHRLPLCDLRTYERPLEEPSARPPAIGFDSETPGARATRLAGALEADRELEDGSRLDVESGDEGLGPGGYGLPRLFADPDAGRLEASEVEEARPVVIG
jgi:hypothetical protein